MRKVIFYKLYSGFLDDDVEMADTNENAMEVEEDDEDEEYEDIPIANESSNEKPKKSTKTGRPFKTFLTSGKSQQRRKLMPSYLEVEKACKKYKVPFQQWLGKGSNFAIHF